ncbi:MAG TPA: superoxide dismutase [Phenylobacterium sp.]|uniref:superoxide dismutase n=1 Tax=Phenylobacterium sp. TaxID=1871053 RepID=UPI002F920167
MFPFPALPYDDDALAPIISARTLRAHHGRHQARHVQVTNELLSTRGYVVETLEEVVVEAFRTGQRKLFDNAAQAWNHGFFWNCMRPGGSALEGRFAQAVVSAFGSLEGLRASFLTEAAAHFGSGWVWLVAERGGLSVASTHNAGTPLVWNGSTPLLACDLWEHAYYLDHQGDRAGFLSAWWDNLVDWTFVAHQFEAENAGQAGWRYPLPALA